MLDGTVVLFSSFFVAVNAVPSIAVPPLILTIKTAPLSDRNYNLNVIRTQYLAFASKRIKPFDTASHDQCLRFINKQAF